jgi:hypothetical protein
MAAADLVCGVHFVIALSRNAAVRTRHLRLVGQTCSLPARVSTSTSHVYTDVARRGAQKRAHGRGTTCAYVSLALIPPSPQFSVLHTTLPGQNAANATRARGAYAPIAWQPTPRSGAGQRVTPTALVRGPFLGAALAGSMSAAPTAAARAMSFIKAGLRVARRCEPLLLFFSCVRGTSPSQSATPDKPHVSLVVCREGATLADDMALRWVAAQPAASGVAITGAALGATNGRRR